MHAVSQQTPSTQWAMLSVPFWQSAAVEQFDPSGFFPHEVPLQKLPLEHWALPEQDGQQMFVLGWQTYARR